MKLARSILFFWCFLAGFLAWFAAQLPTVLGDHGLRTNGAYAEVQKRLASDYHLPDEPAVVLFVNKQGRSVSDYHRFVADYLEEAKKISGVDVAASPLRQKGMENGSYAYALLSVPKEAEARREAVDRLHELLPDDPAYKVMLTGKPVVQEDVNRSSRHDLETAEAIGLPVAFVLLVMTFGGLMPAIIPILAGVLAIVISMGILYAIGASEAAELSIFVYNVVPMVGMAVCLDCALLMVSRFREERAKLPVRAAVLATLSSAGRAVAVSSGCVILALLGTFFIRMPIFSSVALGAIIVLATSALINLTFVPALLVALGDRLSSQRRNKPATRGGWRRWLNLILKHPGWSSLACLAVLAFCLMPLPAMRLAIPGPESLPQGAESRAAFQLFTSRFIPPMASQAYFLIEQPLFGTDAERTAGRIMEDLKRDARVIRIDKRPSLSSDGGYLLTVRLLGTADSPEVMRWVREREQQYSAMNVLIGGEPKYEQEIHDQIFDRIPVVLVFAAASNFLVLAWAFRSLLLPLKAIAMNLLSIGAALGVVSWLFREGKWGLEPADMAVMIPIFVFGLTFGISMDYGIFLLARIYESYGRTRDNEVAIRVGLSVSGRIITSAAAMMIAVTAPFVLAGVTGVKQLGLGIALAIFIDATIIRLILVPSLMKLMGRWNWWLPFARG